MIKGFCLIIITLLNLLSLSAQNSKDKKEFERSVKQDDIPARSLKMVEPILVASESIRYYHEFTEDLEFYEIKLIYKGRHLSIEFYTDGSLYDIEEIISIDDLPKNTAKNLSLYFEKTYRKYRLRRVQKQYSGANHHSVIKNVMSDAVTELTIKYEIEADVMGGENDHFGLYEFLFDKDGQPENSRKIKLRATDNVTY